MATKDFDQYSVELHQEALRSQQRFPSLTYDQAVRLLDRKARNTQLSYGEVQPPLAGCVLPLTKTDIEQTQTEVVI